jgi:hypothetical protein
MRVRKRVEKHKLGVHGDTPDSSVRSVLVAMFTTTGLRL